MKEEHRQIVQFFKDRGERCLKMICLSKPQDNFLDYHCLILTAEGKKQKVSVRVQKPAAKSPTLANCVI